MCQSKAEYLERQAAQKNITIPAPILYHDAGDETTHDPADFVQTDADGRVVWEGYEPTAEETQDERIAALERQLRAPIIAERWAGDTLPIQLAELFGRTDALTDRLVKLAVSHALLKARIELSRTARLKAWVSRRRQYRPQLFKAGRGA